SCSDTPRITRSNYGKLPKIQIKGARTLEVSPDGQLVLTAERGQVCVVPSNLRFDKESDFTPQDLAKQAILQGTVVSSSASHATEMPALQPGVRLVFVPAPDTEFAEFLRAQRARSTAVWTNFLTRYFNSTRVDDAKLALASLFQESAELHLAEYNKSVAAKAPDLTQLGEAHRQCKEALNTLPDNPAAAQLMERVQTETTALTDLDRLNLQTYRRRLEEHSPGYALLEATKRHNGQVIEVNPKYKPALELQSELVRELANVEGAVQIAEAFLSSKHYDEALFALGRYRYFVSEMPRIDNVVTAVYAFHFDKGQRFAKERNWDKAIPEFRRAVGASDRQDAVLAL